MLATFLLLLGCCMAASAAPFGVAPQGEPTTLLDPQQRASLGLRTGPDSIVDVWIDGGRPFLLFSGMAILDGRKAGGATFRLPVDSQLQSATGPLSVLMRADCRDARPDGGRACTRFDSDYAGAGTVFTCPSGRTIYAYHGENHTMPNGMHPSGGNEGWTGIGIATWDSPHGVFLKQGQIAGLNATNAWSSTAMGYGTAQTAAASGNPSLVPDPTGAYLYLYFANRSQNPEVTGPGLGCDRRPCLSVARAAMRDVCAQPGAPGQWQVWHQGRFSEPSLAADGTGGAFTPLDLNGDRRGNTVANVTYLPMLHGYAMTSVLRPGGEIVARTSSDGLTWSAPTTLVPDSSGGKQAYARIVQVPGARGQTALVLLYVKINGHGWANASLLRHPLRIEPG